MNCNHSETVRAGCSVSEAGACQRAIAQTETCTDDWLIGGQEGKQTHPDDSVELGHANVFGSFHCLSHLMLMLQEHTNSHVKHE